MYMSRERDDGNTAGFAFRCTASLGSNGEFIVSMKS